MPNNAWQNAVYLQSGSPETENRPSYGQGSTAPNDPMYLGQLGTRFVVKDRSDSGKAKGYQVVQLDSTMATLPTPGAVALWTNRAKYLVTTSVSTAGRGNPAGVFRITAAAADVTNQNIVCVQILGMCENVVFLSSPTSPPDTTGKFVIPSATDGQADCLGAGTAATYPVLGTAQGAVTANQGPVELTVGVETP